MITEQVTQAFALPAKEGRALWHLGALINFKALGDGDERRILGFGRAG